MIKTIKFARKPFYVDAIQVTAENMDEVAKWCMGDVQTTVKPEGAVEEKYVKVRVHRPLTERQTKAFIGDWVLYAGTGFKVYTPRAFEKSFEKVTTLSKEQADEAGIHPPIEGKTPMVMAHQKGTDRTAMVPDDEFVTVYRDAATGRYVDEDYAEEHPNTTVAETQVAYAAEQMAKEEAEAVEAERLLAELES